MWVCLAQRVLKPHIWTPWHPREWNLLIFMLVLRFVHLQGRHCSQGAIHNELVFLRYYFLKGQIQNGNRMKDEPKLGFIRMKLQWPKCLRPMVMLLGSLENGIWDITNNSYHCNKDLMNILDCLIPMTWDLARKKTSNLILTCLWWMETKPIVLWKMINRCLLRNTPSMPLILLGKIRTIRFSFIYLIPCLTFHYMPQKSIVDILKKGYMVM